MIHRSYSPVKIINLTSRPGCGLNRLQMPLLPAVRIVVRVRESQALVARRIPFIGVEPGSG